MKTGKRILSLLLAAVLVLSGFPETVFAKTGQGETLCAEHHPQHTAECGYREAVEGHACTHVCGEECFRTVKNCTHTHGADGCTYVPEVAGKDCTCGSEQHSDECGYRAAVAATGTCNHTECTEASGCVKKEAACVHTEHNADCGFVPAVEAVACSQMPCAKCAEQQVQPQKTQVDFAELDDTIPVIFQTAGDMDMHDYLTNAFGIDVPFTCSPATIPYGKYDDGETFTITVTATGDYEGSRTVEGEVRYIAPAVISRVLSVRYTIKEKSSGKEVFSRTIAPRNDFNSGVERISCSLDSGKEYEMTITYGETKFDGYDHTNGQINSITTSDFTEIINGFYETEKLTFSTEGVGGGYASTGSAKCHFKSNDYGKYTITTKMDVPIDSDRTREIALTITFRGPGKEESKSEEVIGGKGLALTASILFPETYYDFSWSKNGTVISGANGRSYTPEELKPGEVYVATINRKTSGFSTENGCIGGETWTHTFKVSNEVMVLPEAVSGLVYNGSAQKTFTTGSGEGYAFFFYPPNFDGFLGFDYDSFWNYYKHTDAGTYKVYYYVNRGLGTPTVKSGTLYCTIEKATPVLSQAPAAVTGLTFSGSPQTLVTAGKASAGTVQYSLDNSNWSNDLPKGTDAGTYTVYYRINGNKNYNTVVPSNNKVTVTVAPKAAPTVEAPVGKQNLVYDGSAQALLETPGSVTSGGSLAYALTTDETAPDAAAYTEQLPTATAAGTYRVWYKAAGNNYQTNTPASISVTIGKAAAALTATPTGKSLTYIGEPQELVSAGSASMGTLVYAVTDTSVEQAPTSGYTQTLPNATNVGSYRIWFRIDGNSNVEGLAAAYVDAQIKAAELTVTAMTAQKTYDGNGSIDSLQNLTLNFNGLQSADTLVFGTDYTVTGLTLAPRNDKFDAGTGYVLTADIALKKTALSANYVLSNGQGYAGTVEILARPIGEVTITAIEDRTYNRQAHTPDIQAAYLDLPALVKNTDYTLGYKENTNVGTATVTVTGKGNYSGSRDVTFVIKPAVMDQTWLTTSIAEFTYNSAKQVPTVTVNGGETYGNLIMDADYTVTYTGSKGSTVAEPTDVDTYTLTVTGKGNYSGSLTATFQIKAMAVTVTPNANQSKVYGAEEPALTYTLDKALPGGETLTAPLKRAQGENVGSYAISLAAASANPNYTLTLAEGSHSFAVTALELTATNTAAAAPDLLYTGKEQNLTPVLTVTLPSGSTQVLDADDFDITGNKATGIGSYDMTVTGKGNFTGTLTVTRKIVPDSETLAAVTGGSITPDNVSLTQKEDLETLKDALDSVTEDTKATEAEREAWEDAAEKLPDILKKLDELDKSLNTKEYQAAIKITPTTVTAADKETLEDGKKDIQAYLYANSDNITDAEETRLKEEMDAIDACLDEIEKAQPTIDEVKKWLKDNAGKFKPDALDLRKEWQDMDSKIQALPENVRRIAKGALDKDMADAKSKLYTYTITATDGNRWIRGSKKDLPFKANGHIDLFVEVQIDGKTLDPENYEVKSGSTLITLKRSYLSKLSKGNHTIVAVYTDGQTAAYTFRVVAQSVIPNTGDQIMAAVAVMALSGAAIAVLILLKKRKK